MIGNREMLNGYLCVLFFVYLEFLFMECKECVI